VKIYKNLNLRDLKNETWKIIEEFPEYLISNFSRIKSIKKNKILKQTKSSTGYLRARLCQNKIIKTRRVHRLLYETFIEKLKCDEVVHHKNKNKLENTFENLEKKPTSKHTGDHNKNRIIK
jgi:hypothetical protein